jgi:serine/threonine protein kinase/formylglycine-generating enzyme required for sulfatase activity
VLCYRCGAHVKDGAEKCTSCGQPFAVGLKPGSIAGFGTGSRRGRAAIEGAPYKIGEAVAARFQVKDHLGAGPLGWVFRATDTESGESVSLKVLSPRFLQLPEEQSAFLQEMERTRTLEHGNIAHVVASGLDGPRPWIASQLLDGLTLRRIMDLRRQKGQSFALLEVEPIVAQIAAALDASLAAHGDLKPDNIVVLPDLLKLTDFGLALCLPRAPFVAAQRAGQVQRYFAPEILAGQPIGSRADVFSLGVMLGEMLAGAPFDSLLEGKLREVGVSIPVEQVFLRAVAPRPEERYASPADLSAALTDAIHGPPPAQSDDDDVFIEHAQTDPRVRIARALASQDAERSMRSQAEQKAQQSSSQITAPAIPSVLPSFASLPPLSSPPMSLPPLSMPPLSLESFSAPPRLQTPPLAPPPQHDFEDDERTTIEEAPSAPLSAISAQTTQLAPPAPALDFRPGETPSQELARVAASVGATPSAPPPPAELPPPAATPSAPLAPLSAPPVALPTLEYNSSQPPVLPDEEPELDPRDETPEAPLASAPPPSQEGDEPEPGRGGKRRGRGGRKARREEARVARKNETAAPSQPAPVPPRPNSLELRASADTQELTPLFALKLAEPRTEKVATQTSSVAAPIVLEKPAEPPPARSSGSRPPAAPLSFGAPVDEKRGPSVPMLAIGAVIVAALLYFGWTQLSSKNDEKPVHAAPAAPAATPPGAPPVPAKTEATPTSAPATSPAATPAPAALVPAPAAPAPVAPAKKEPVVLPPEYEDKTGNHAKKSFKEKLLERRDASKHGGRGDDEPEHHAEPTPIAPAPAATPAAVAAKPPPAATPAPTPVTATPPPAAAPIAVAAATPPTPAAGSTDEGVALVTKSPPPPAPAAAAQGCPEGMKRIGGGPAHVGTEAADDMRNFGDRPPATVQMKAYCIDSYEWPNAAGRAPKIAAGFSEADSSCKKAGKRLCSEDEWEKACKGPSDLRFPYGSTFDPDSCNTQDKDGNPRKLAASGAYPNCHSGYGVYDLSGNAAEWTASPFEGAGGDRAVKGGNATRPSFDDRCSSRRRLATSAHDLNVGFRCCAELK